MPYTEPFPSLTSWRTSWAGATSPLSRSGGALRLLNALNLAVTYQAAEPPAVMNMKRKTIGNMNRFLRYHAR